MCHSDDPRDGDRPRTRASTARGVIRGTYRSFILGLTAGEEVTGSVNAECDNDPTDPNNPDTDAGGCDDGTEVLVEGTDPNNDADDSCGGNTADSGQHPAPPSCACRGRQFFEPKWSVLLLGLLALRRRP